MGQKHKHAELIKAWADGAEIQFKAPDDDKFRDCLANPAWENDVEYRIKPEPKPDVVSYLVRLKSDNSWHEYQCEQLTLGKYWQIKLIVDCETDKLKSAEVIG